MATISLTGLFYPAPGKRQDTGLENPHVIFIPNDKPDYSSRAILFEPSAVVEMPTQFDRDNEVTISVYEDAVCCRKQGGAYLSEIISVAVNQMGTDDTYTRTFHSNYF